MRISKILAAIALLLSMSACANSDIGMTQGIGTVLGGAAGAVAGAQFGKGKGQLASTAAGTLIGAFLGNEVGKSLDRADQLYAQQSVQRAIVAPMGTPINWSNPRSGNRGRVVATREGRRNDGAYCREFQQTIIVGGQAQQAYGTACRQPDGSWQFVD